MTAAKPGARTGRPTTPFWDCMTTGTGCWEWTKTRSSAGYGSRWRHGRMEAAHRVAWELTYGPIPDGMQVLHRCDNPPCCRPDHLFLGTNTDNYLDKIAKGRARGLRGEENRSAKLSEAQIVAIRRRYGGRRGELVRLAREYGVSDRAIAYVVKRQTWRHVETA